MVSMTEIEALAQRIAELFQPEKIILFGSYAYGTPTPDSDVDLLVIMDFEGRSAQKATEIFMVANPRFPTDLLVRTSDVVYTRAEQGDFFLREILSQGKVLYEAVHA